MTLYTTWMFVNANSLHIHLVLLLLTLTVPATQSLYNNHTLFVSFSSGFHRDPEKEDTVRAEGMTGEADCLRWPHSVQWLDLGQSLLFADLFGQYRTLLWTLCCKALWLQLHVPQTGSTAGSISLQDNHRRLQILHRISQVAKTGKKCV